MRKCDHIVGYSTGVDESWLTRWSKSGQDSDYLDTRFKFCPECGANIENLKLKRRYNHPKWNEATSPVLAELNKMALEMMLEKARSFRGSSLSGLNESGTFSRELGTTITERISD